MGINTQFKYSTCTQYGATLVELMIAITLGSVLILAISRLTISTVSVQSSQNSVAAVHDTAGYALNNIAQSVRQAGFVNYDNSNELYANADFDSPGIYGLDASTLKASSYGVESPITSSNHSSDVLVVRFYGTGNSDSPILNCGGFPVTAPTSATSTETDRGWSIYYVANDNNGEPNLYCKYKKNKFTAQSIAQGVESFQVLYGLDTSNPPDGIADQFLRSTEINRLDAAISESELYKHTHWKRITAVKVAILIRGSTRDRASGSDATYNLFGSAYANSKSSADKGSQIRVADIPKEQQQYFRKVFTTTVNLKNSLK
ncbi:type IV pilus assembly protein PilW [Oxalobacteraceae bacterium GrIS 2.11]